MSKLEMHVGEREKQPTTHKLQNQHGIFLRQGKSDQSRKLMHLSSEMKEIKVNRKINTQ